VLLDLSWLEVSTDRAHLDTWVTRDEQKLAKCLLHVYIDSCKGRRPFYHPLGCIFDPWDVLLALGVYF
jgi:hypothetical protein